MTIHSLLKIKERLKSTTKIELLILMRVFSKLAYSLPFHYEMAFSTTPESEDSLAVEN